MSTPWVTISHPFCHRATSPVNSFQPSPLSLLVRHEIPAQIYNFRGDQWRRKGAVLNLFLFFCFFNILQERCQSTIVFFSDLLGESLAPSRSVPNSNRPFTLQTISNLCHTRVWLRAHGRSREKVTS